MPQKNAKPPIASTLATWAGCAIVFGSLLLALEGPKLHFGIAIAIGAVLGTPFIVLGIRLHERSIPDNPTSKQFWPKREDGRHLFWGIALFATLFACLFGPVAIGILVAPLLPSGDGWGIVTGRVSLVALTVLGGYWWVKFAVTAIPTWFHGRISSKLYDLITREEPPEEPKSAIATAFKNWQLALIALAAFCVAYGVVELDNPLLDIDVGPKRARALVGMIQWCRGNPNTVVSSSLLVGVAALGRYVFLIRRAAAKPKATVPKTAETKE